VTPPSSLMSLSLCSCEGSADGTDRPFRPRQPGGAFDGRALVPPEGAASTPKGGEVPQGPGALGVAGPGRATAGPGARRRAGAVEGGRLREKADGQALPQRQPGFGPERAVGPARAARPGGGRAGERAPAARPRAGGDASRGATGALPGAFGGV